MIPKFLLLASSFAALAAAAVPFAGATTATFTLTAGTLSISAPAGPVALGASQVASTSARTFNRPTRYGHRHRRAWRRHSMGWVCDFDRVHSRSGEHRRPGSQRQLWAGHDHAVDVGHHAIGSLSAERSKTGEPLVVARVRNTGQRTLDISGSLTHVDARILANDSYVPTAPGAASVGKRTPYVPAWRATAVATYKLDQRWTYTLAGRYSTRPYATVDNTDAALQTLLAV